MPHTIEPPRRPSVYLPQVEEASQFSISRVFILSAIGCAIVSCFLWQGPTNTFPAEAASSPSELQAKRADVKLASFGCYNDGAALLLGCNFKIRNNSDIPAKDVVIKCSGTARSGTEIDINIRTIYETIEPHSARTFNRFSMGLIDPQVNRESCRLESWKSGY